MILTCTCRICSTEFFVTVADDLWAGLAHYFGNLKPNVCRGCDQKHTPVLRADEVETCQGIGTGKSRAEVLARWAAMLPRYRPESYERQKLALKMASVRAAQPGQKRGREY
jgi:hypothetical protein